MSDSLLGVNRSCDGFGIIIPNAARCSDVPSNRDDVISSFVRLRIREWRESGREMQELARVAGFAKSTPSQVMLGTGVGAKTGPRFAKAFGFQSYDEMKSAAWEWWKAQGKAGQEAVDLPKTDAMREAIEAVLSLNQGTREQLETILTAFSHPRFRDRNKDWWLQTLLVELTRDREALRDDRALRGEITSKQKQFREEHAKKRRRAEQATERAPRKKRAG